MAQINPHINFNGNAEEAFLFYRSVFGGEFAKIMRFKDLSSPEFPVAEKEANKIMHIALPIGKNILMANDVPEIMGQTNENENRSKIAISAESRDEWRGRNGIPAGAAGARRPPARTVSRHGGKQGRHHRRHDGRGLRSGC